MWDYLNKLASGFTAASESLPQHQALIVELLSLPEQPAVARLGAAVQEMNEQDFGHFTMALGISRQQIEQGLQMLRNQASSAWGNTVEDQLAYSVAQFQSGEAGQSPQEMQLQQMLQGIDAIYGYAQHFWQQRLVGAAQSGAPAWESAGHTMPGSGSRPPAMSGGKGGASGRKGDGGPGESRSGDRGPSGGASGRQPQSNPAATDASFEQVLEELKNMTRSGQVDPALMSKLMAVAQNPEHLEEITRLLQKMGGDEGPSPTMNIEDYYKPGSQLFQLRWPIQTPLPVTFEQLDPKTQFFVLFGEWTRRETEGGMTLSMGQTDAAQQIFEECLERGRQLAVPELEARSYEGMMRVAQRLGDRTLERQWVKAAMDARRRG